MAALLRWVLASTLAEFGVTNNAWILTVEEDIFDILILQIGALQDILQIVLSET